MVETVLLSFLFAKFKGYKLKPILKSWTIYPVLIFTCIYLVEEATIFKGNYNLIKYSSIFKFLYLSSFLILIIKYNLYKSAIVGSIFIFIGSALNNIAISVNNGKMPAFPTLSYLTGYVNKDSFIKVNDIHVLGNSATHMKFLTDIFDVGYSVMSIGDIFIRIFALIIIYYSIKNSFEDYRM